MLSVHNFYKQFPSSHRHFPKKWPHFFAVNWNDLSCWDNLYWTRNHYFTLTNTIISYFCIVVSKLKESLNWYFNSDRDHLDTKFHIKTLQFLYLLRHLHLSKLFKEHILNNKIFSNVIPGHGYPLHVVTRFKLYIMILHNHRCF